MRNIWLTRLIIMCAVVLISASAGAVPPDPRTPGPFSTAVTVIDEGCNYDLDGTSLTWSDPPFFGPTTFNVVFGDHDFSGSDTRCPGSPAALVDMKLRVHYPGTPGVVAAGGPFPVVVILHGQQIFSIPGYEGYDYLGTLLASHGFIVASIDGRSLLDSTIKSRGEHVREHLRRLVTRNAPGSGSFLSGKLDLSKVSLIGHSRGGDSVVATWEWQRVDPDPGYTIAAVIAIAPVQFFGRIGGEPSFIQHMRDVHFQIIHGSKDGDVSDFQGLRLYDRSADIRAVGQTLKSMVFVRDANHNFFNTVWQTLEGDDYCCGGVLSGPTARDIAEVYIHSFLQTVINGDAEFRTYLTGETPNPVAATTVSVDFQAPSAEFFAVDHFEELPGVKHKPGRNSVKGPVSKKQLVKYSESSLAAGQVSPVTSYKGETFGAYLFWLGKPDPRFGSGLRPVDIPPDPVAFDHLSFRVGQVARSAGSINPPGANQDFQVQITDAARDKAVVTVSDFAPVHPPFPTQQGGVKTVMSVVRVPLSAFIGIDLTRIRKVEFLFNQVALGEVVVDDLRFTK